MHWFHAPVTRRRFILSTGALAASAALPHVLFAKTGGPGRLVVVILRGALDGLAAVPPYGDPDYAGLHRELAIAAPGTADGALKLDGTFGLHPSLGFLHERYLGGELIVFQATASPYRDRSHFDGQNVLENGLAHPIGGRSREVTLGRAKSSRPLRSARDPHGRAPDRQRGRLAQSGVGLTTGARCAADLRSSRRDQPEHSFDSAGPRGSAVQIAAGDAGRRRGSVGAARGPVLQG